LFHRERAGTVIRDTQGTIGLVADYRFEQVPSPDVILVPGGQNNTYGNDTVRSFLLLLESFFAVALLPDYMYVTDIMHQGVLFESTCP
jgi:hypothetical protein